MRDPNELVHGTRRLPDGRMLAYAECGDPQGVPVFFFHGVPSSRLLHPDGGIAASLGARLITVDRPGFGGSDFYAGRQVLDWPDDVSALADSLGLDRYAVAGISGGGPYAAACAFKIPQRLTGAAMVSSFGPVEIPGAVEGMPRERRLVVNLIHRAPWAVRPLLWAFRHPSRNPERFYKQYTSHNSASDREIIDHPAVRSMLIASYGESTRQGVRGLALELILLTRPWGFGLGEIETPVDIWHGDEDRSTPLVMAQAMAAAIPHSRATYLPGEGHFLLVRHWKEILQGIVGTTDRHR